MKKTLFALLLGLFPVLTYAALSGTFTISPLSGNAPLTASLNWNVTGTGPGTRCTASGDWAGLKTFSGTESTGVLLNDSSFTLTCVTPATPATPPGTGQVTLSWTPPTENTDGTSLTNLSGFRIVYGQSASALTRTIDINNPAISTYVVEGLSGGVWYFAIRAFTASGMESANSNVANKNLGTLSPGTPAVAQQTWTKTISIDVNAQPLPPVLRVAEPVAYQLNGGANNKISFSRVGSVALGRECFGLPTLTDEFRTVRIIKNRDWAVMDPDPKKPGAVFARPRQVWAICRPENG